MEYPPKILGTFGKNTSKDSVSAHDDTWMVFFCENSTYKKHCVSCLKLFSDTLEKGDITVMGNRNAWGCDIEGGTVLGEAERNSEKVQP